ncbi:MAG: NFACT RNA binding domain-containing protein [Armatimonadota bacterium]|nr:NFACT RNA binding domain-containing protein [Armatimonadota bacterium]
MRQPKPIPFDSLSLYATLHERAFFIGGRIQEIRQPEPLTIVLNIYAQRTEHWLLISADAQFARMHCLSRKLPNAPTPPPFLQSLRKHIEGGIIRACHLVGFDRIVQMEVQTREGVYRLMVELMGKHSNIILVEPVGLIRSAIKWVSPRQSEARPIRAGDPYRLPPTRVEGLRNPLTMTDDEWYALWHEMGEPRDWQAHLEGLSRFTADELEAIAQTQGLSGILEWAYRLREGLWEPVVVRDPATRRALGAYPFRSLQLPAEWQHARTSVNLAWEQAFHERIQHAQFESLRQTLLPNLRRAVQARERAVADLERALHDTQQANRWQLYGELILAFGHSLPPDATVLHAPDYTQPDAPLIEIPLDPTKSLAENAERYFQKARRARESRSELQARLERLRDELTALYHALHTAEQATDEASLRALHEQAKQQGWLREAPPTPTKRPEKDPFEGHKIRVHLSPDGYQVLVGENAQANDYLLTRVAKPNDWWLHVRTGTGAHVIIRTNNQPERVPKSTLEFAAKLAAQHSADKHARVVEVDYTLRKYVRKPKGAPTGFALYTHEKTLRVEPKG